MVVGVCRAHPGFADLPAGYNLTVRILSSDRAGGAAFIAVSPKGGTTWEESS
jgi:hypothetical protein